MALFIKKLKKLLTSMCQNGIIKPEREVIIMRHNKNRWNNKMVAMALKEGYQIGSKYSYNRFHWYDENFFAGYGVSINDALTGKEYDKLYFCEEKAEKFIDKYAE